MDEIVNFKSLLFHEMILSNHGAITIINQSQTSNCRLVIKATMAASH